MDSILPDDWDYQEYNISSEWLEVGFSIINSCENDPSIPSDCVRHAANSLGVDLSEFDFTSPELLLDIIREEGTHEVFSSILMYLLPEDYIFFMDSGNAPLHIGKVTHVESGVPIIEHVFAGFLMTGPAINVREYYERNTNNRISGSLIVRRKV